MLRLEGGWQVAPLDITARLDPTELPEHGWVNIPDCTHLQLALYPDRPYWGEHLRRINESAWVFRRTFAMPETHYLRTRLQFDGVDYYADVWLNGHYVGQHEGHFTPFIFDITPYLRPSADNELVIRVTAPWDAPNPRGTYPTDHVIRGLVKGLYEHGEGVIPPDVNPLGIWRPVWLLLDNGLSIDAVHLQTALDGAVSLEMSICNATGAACEGTLNVGVTGENHTGPGVEAALALQLAPGLNILKTTLNIPEPRLWWPEGHGNPDLYRLTMSVRDATAATLAAHSQVFGVRTVRLERSAQRFTWYINQKPVAIRGTSYMPGLYLSQVTPASLERDVKLAQDAHLNLLRVHVHVAPPALYDLCDRYGMLVWQDFELSWIQDYSPAFEQRARTLQRAMIDQLGKHPSIITWTCHNEPTMVFLRRQNLEQRPDPALYADAQAQDSSRPVFICSGQIEDDWQRAGDSHTYYGAIWSQRYTDVYSHHARLNTEFGFEAPAAMSTLASYPDTWSRLQHLEAQVEPLWRYQAALIQYHVEHYRRLRADGCAGYIHFWLADLVPQVGCGVLDSNRIKKGGYAALRQASRPLLPILEHDGRRPVALWVLNDTDNMYSQAVLNWCILDETGAELQTGFVHCDIRPNAAQKIASAQWQVDRQRCHEIRLTLRSSDGEPLVENAYLRPFQPLLRPAGYPWKFNHYLGTKVFDQPGAPSLADQGISPIIRWVPLPLREQIAERALRQRMPTALVSIIARVLDWIMG